MSSVPERLYVRDDGSDCGHVELTSSHDSARHEYVRAERERRLANLLMEHAVEWERDDDQWDEFDWHNRVVDALERSGIAIDDHNDHMAEQKESDK